MNYVYWIVDHKTIWLSNFFPIEIDLTCVQLCYCTALDNTTVTVMSVKIFGRSCYMLWLVFYPLVVPTHLIIQWLQNPPHIIFSHAYPQFFPSFPQCCFHKVSIRGVLLSPCKTAQKKKIFLSNMKIPFKEANMQKKQQQKNNT